MCSTAEYGCRVCMPRENPNKVFFLQNSVRDNINLDLAAAAELFQSLNPCGYGCLSKIMGITII